MLVDNFSSRNILEELKGETTIILYIVVPH